MSRMEPRFTEAAMERYCHWIRNRLIKFRNEHGVEPLHRCKGEVDFSHNSMSNQMVWMLLQTLAQHEVHTALLKLYGNCITQGGVLAICEFIRLNEHAEALQELHLSHNQIDDESALELLRTLHSHRPRYPPKRKSEGNNKGCCSPVWLRLNHNRIRNPSKVLDVAQEEGITICPWDRQVSGTIKSRVRDTPIVHLYSISAQDVPREDLGEKGKKNRKRNKKDRREVADGDDGEGGDPWGREFDGPDDGEDNDCNDHNLDQDCSVDSQPKPDQKCNLDVDQDHDSSSAGHVCREQGGDAMQALPPPPSAPPDSASVPWKPVPEPLLDEEQPLKSPPPALPPPSLPPEQAVEDREGNDRDRSDLEHTETATQQPNEPENVVVKPESGVDEALDGGSNAREEKEVQ